MTTARRIQSAQSRRPRRQGGQFHTPHRVEIIQELREVEIAVAIEVNSFDEPVAKKKCAEMNVSRSVGAETGS